MKERKLLILDLDETLIFSDKTKSIEVFAKVLQQDIIGLRNTQDSSRYLKY